MTLVKLVNQSLLSTLYVRNLRNFMKLILSDQWQYSDLCLLDLIQILFVMRVLSVKVRTSRTGKSVSSLFLFRYTRLFEIIC
jgi:hypothetical protein